MGLSGNSNSLWFGIVTNIVHGLEWFEGREARRERGGSGKGVRK